MMVQQIRTYCDLLEQKIDDIKPEKEWLTTEEFAKEEDLKLKTVSNYCGMGKYGDNQRQNEKGYWEIKRTELSTNNE